MTRKFETVVILGAGVEGCSKHELYQRNDDLRNALLRQGLAFDGLNALSQDGKLEQKYLIVTDDVNGMLELAKKFQQTSLTVSDSNRLTSLIDVNTGDKEELGVLARCTKKDLAQGAKLVLVVQDSGADYYYSTSTL